jgi:hypothetical protein
MATCFGPSGPSSDHIGAVSVKDGNWILYLHRITTGCRRTWLLWRQCVPLKHWYLEDGSLWDVAPCSLVGIDRCFRGTSCLQGDYPDDGGSKFL